MPITTRRRLTVFGKRSSTRHFVTPSRGMTMRRVAQLLVLVLALLPAVAVAQSGAIRGRVLDATGQPLARASISAEGSGLTTSTNDQGRYEIRGVSAGTYTVRVRLLGFVAQAAKGTVADSPGRH